MVNDSDVIEIVSDSEDEWRRAEIKRGKMKMSGSNSKPVSTASATKSLKHALSSDEPVKVDRRSMYIPTLSPFSHHVDARSYNSVLL